MNRVNAYRRWVLTSAPACKSIVQSANDVAPAIQRLLDDGAAMAGALRTRARLTAADMSRLIEPLITDAELIPATAGDIETCRFMAQYA